MARSVDPVAHAVRRDAYVEEAIRLIQTRGYEQLSIQDVIDGAGTSKGAFFHSFNSKGALLAAVIDRMVETAASIVAPVAADADLSAVQKLQGVFSGIARWKGEQPELQPAAVEALMRTWYSDENSIVVERMRAAVGQRLTPLLLEILRQGAADGEFTLVSPEGTASVLTSLMLGLDDEAIQLFLGRRDGTVSLERVTCTLKAYADAFERILGLPPMSWPIVDQATVTYWFA
ncbi:MAG: TetR/AcrR family transcriptional regulator [Candidatus Limnocylindrales bacterium]